LVILRSFQQSHNQFASYAFTVVEAHSNNSKVTTFGKRKEIVNNNQLGPFLQCSGIIRWLQQTAKLWKGIGKSDENDNQLAVYYGK